MIQINLFRKIQPAAATFLTVCFLITLTPLCSPRKKVTGFLGDTVNTEKFAISVTSVNLRSGVGSKIFKSKAAPGAVFIAVDWTCKNISAKPIGSFSFPHLKLQDPKGTKYDPDRGASSDYNLESKSTRKLLSDLNPGVSFKDSEVFEVSEQEWSQTGWKAILGDAAITIN